MVVFSMPSTHSEKCTASAAPDSSISRPLSHVLRLRSAAVQSLRDCDTRSQHACAQEFIWRAKLLLLRSWRRAFHPRSTSARAAPTPSTMMPLSHNHLPEFPSLRHCHNRSVSSVERCDVQASSSQCSLLLPTCMYGSQPCAQQTHLARQGSMCIGTRYQKRRVARCGACGTARDSSRPAESCQYCITAPGSSSSPVN